MDLTMMKKGESATPCETAPATLTEKWCDSRERPALSDCSLPPDRWSPMLEGPSNGVKDSLPNERDSSRQHTAAAWQHAWSWLSSGSLSLAEIAVRKLLSRTCVEVLEPVVEPGPLCVCGGWPEMVGPLPGGTHREALASRRFDSAAPLFQAHPDPAGHSAGNRSERSDSDPGDRRSCGIPGPGDGAGRAAGRDTFCRATGDNF